MCIHAYGFNDFMTQEATVANNTPLNLISKLSLYSKKLASGLETIGEGFYLEIKTFLPMILHS